MRSASALGFLAVLAALISPCSLHALTQAKLADSKEYPHTVHLSSFNRRNLDEKGVPKTVHVCTGTLFYDRWVLTSYHCFHKEDDARMVVHSKGAATYAEKDVLTPFNPKTRLASDDLALIRLDRPLGKGYTVDILAKDRVDFTDKEALLKAAEDPKEGIRAMAVGCGKTGDKDKETPKNIADRRRVGTIRLWADGSFFVAEKDGASYRHTTFSQPDPTLFEEGDSGGPIFITLPDSTQALYAVFREYLGKRETGEQVGAIHALIPHHRRWIEARFKDAGDVK